MDYDRLDLFMKKETIKQKKKKSETQYFASAWFSRRHAWGMSQLKAANQQHVHILEAAWRFDPMDPSLF